VPETTKPFSFALSPHSNYDTSVSDSVTLHPSSFANSQPLSSIFSIRDKWLMNLSSKPIPKNVQLLIQLGDNFALSTFNKNKLTKEIIKSVESNIKKFPPATHNVIRNRSISIINNLTSFSPQRNPIDNHIMKLKKYTQQFLKNNSNVILTRADKGNITVALDKDNYVNKINDMLSDNSIYTKVKKDPMKSIIGSLRKILTT